MTATTTHSGYRHLLTTFLGASALYLLMLVIFYVGQPWIGGISTNPYIIRVGIGLLLLGMFGWLTYRLSNPRLIGLTYLVLVAGAAPFLVPLESFDQLVPLYILAICAASFVLIPMASCIFVTVALVIYTATCLFNPPATGFNYVAWSGLFILAMTVWLIAILLNRTQKQTQQALDEKQLALEKLPVGMYVADANGQIQYANSALVQLLKYPSSDALKATPLATTSVDPRMRQQWQNKIMTTDIGGTDMQWRCYDGTTLWTHETTRVLRNPAGQIVNYEGTVENITARKQSEDEQARYIKVMTMLYEVTRDLEAQHTPSALLPVLVQRAATLVGSTQTRLYLCGSNPGTWDLMASTDLPEPVRSDLMSEDEEMVTQVTQTRQAVLVNAFTPLPQTSSQRRKFDTGSNAAVPLLLNKNLTGVLVVHHSDPLHRFDDQDLHVLSLFANHAAATVSNAQQLERAGQNELFIASLNQAARRLEHQKSQTDVLQTACDALKKLGKFALAFEQQPNGGLAYTQWTSNQELLALVKTGTDPQQSILAIPDALLATLRKQFEADFVVRNDDFFMRLADAQPDESNAPAHLLAKQMKGKGIWLIPISSFKNLLGLLVLVSERSEASLLPVLALFAQSITRTIEQLRTQAAHQQSEVEFQSLRRVSGSWRTKETERDVAGEALSEALNLFGTKAGFIMLYGIDPADQPTTITQGWFTSASPALLDDDQSIVKHVLTSGQPYTSKDLLTDSFHIVSPTAQVPSGWGGIGVPIPGLSKTQGVLYVAIQQPRQITHAETRLLLIIAESIGLASAFKHLTTQDAPLQALHDSMRVIASATSIRSIADQILGQMTAYLKADAASLLVLNPEIETLEFVSGRGFHSKLLEQSRVKIGEGLAGRAAQQHIIVRVAQLNEEKTKFAQSVLIEGEGFQSYLAVPLLIYGQTKGVIEIYHRAAPEFPSGWEDFLKGLAVQLAMALAMELVDTSQALEEKFNQLEHAYDLTLAAWSKMLEIRDQGNIGHTQRVSDLSIKLASSLGVEATVLHTIRRGAWLHDIGKQSIPDSILLAPRPLTTEEWEIVRKHPQIAYDLLSAIDILKEPLVIPYCHHERWDGKGYPKGLRGEAIPLAARIFAVVDTWEALISERPYRAAWNKERTRAYLRTLAGTQLDPQLVEAFLKLD